MLRIITDETASQEEPLSPRRRKQEPSSVGREALHGQTQGISNRGTESKPYQLLLSVHHDLDSP